MSYIINSPIQFDATTHLDTLDFDANVTAFSRNLLRNFVTTTRGDMVYRNTGTANNLTRLAVGATAGGVLYSNGSIPVWGAGGSAFDQLTVISGVPTWKPYQGFLAYGTSAGTSAIPASSWTTLGSTYISWDDSTAPGYDTATSFSTSTGRWTVPDDGYYTVSATFHFGGSLSGGGAFPAQRGGRIYNATDTAVISETLETSISSFIGTPVQITANNVLLSAGDQIVVQAFHTVFGGLSLSFFSDNMNYFSAFLHKYQ